MPANDPYGRNGPTLEQLLTNRENPTPINNQTSSIKIPPQIRFRPPSPSVNQKRISAANDDVLSTVG